MAPDTAPRLLLVADIGDESGQLASDPDLSATWQIETVTSGAHAMARILRQPPPDLIVLGSLDDMEGVTVYQQLRADPATKDFPLLLVTSSRGSAIAQPGGLQPGVSDWITRPINPALVGLRADNLLAMKRQREALRLQSAEIAQRTASLEESNRRLCAEVEERKRMEQDLRSALDDLAIAKERAEEADRLKSVFLAAVSHELRTPMNSIIGFTGILYQGLAGPLNDEQKKQLGIVRKSAEHLLSLVNDVLDLSKIAAGQLALSSTPFDLPTSLATVINTARPLAELKGLTLAMTLDPDIGMMVSDRRRVEQIIANLLHNAIKFTPRGSVTIEGRAHAGTVIIRVKDTGIGIKQEDIPQLFRAFQQVETGLARRYGGTGLGLAMCAKLTTLLGGTISVDSVWTQGSTFTVTLPVAKVAARPQAT